jgi:prepilin peptidase CpaA
MPIFLVIFIICLLGASVYDIIYKKIPNWISLIIIVSGLSFNYLSFGKTGLLDSGMGVITGLLLMLPCYIFGSMGAGDVKLIAAIGSFAGFNKQLDIVIYSFFIMFVIAVLFITVKGDLIKFLNRYKVIIYGLFVGIFSYQKPDINEAAAYRLPLAPAISVASIYVMHPEICKLKFIADLCHLLN